MGTFLPLPGFLIEWILIPNDFSLELLYNNSKRLTMFMSLIYYNDL